MSVTTAALDIIRSTRVESRPSQKGEGKPAERAAGKAELPAEFWELVEHYRGELTNQALAVTGNLDDAEEVVQETFCEAFRHSEKMKDVRSLGAWLRSINHSNALDFIRGAKRTQHKAERKQKLAPDRMHTTGGFSIVEMRDLIAKAVEHLNPNMRTAVVLCYWEHLTPDQIAERMNVSARTVRRLLFDATLLMHGKLGPYLPPPATPPATPPSDNPDSQTNAETNNDSAR
jgi:RNA polymerase sigma factor (sigma-70 family)